MKMDEQIMLIEYPTDIDDLDRDGNAIDADKEALNADIQKEIANFTKQHEKSEEKVQEFTKERENQVVIDA